MLYKIINNELKMFFMEHSPSSIGIFGTGLYGIDTYKFISDLKIQGLNFINFYDNNKERWNSTLLENYTIFEPTKENLNVCDFILVASSWNKEIKKQLIELSIPNEKIYVVQPFSISSKGYLKNLVYKNINSKFCFYGNEEFKKNIINFFEKTSLIFNKKISFEEYNYKNEFDYYITSKSFLEEFKENNVANNGTIITVENYELEIEEIQNNSIVVYQAGKVASRSIKSTLESISPKKNLRHIHYLGKALDEKVKELEENQTSTSPYYTKLINIIYYYKPVSDSIFLNNKKIDNLKFITISREPISRAISAYFENIQYYFPNYLENFRNNDLNIDDLINDFFKRVRNTNDTWFNIDKWFDLALNKTLDINIYDYPFNHKHKFKEISSDRYSILLLRTEDISFILPTALKKFLNISHEIEIKNSNISKMKAYNKIYTEFKKKISIPSWYIDQEYNTKYMNYFYTQNEIDSFKSKLNIDTMISLT